MFFKIHQLGFAGDWNCNCDGLFRPYADIRELAGSLLYLVNGWCELSFVQCILNYFGLLVRRSTRFFGPFVKGSTNDRNGCHHVGEFHDKTAEHLVSDRIKVW